MTLQIQPAPLSGQLRAIVSKSHVHRLLLCAALADRPTRLVCRLDAADLAATARCLQALGAKIRQDGDICTITPVGFSQIPSGAPVALDCGESGSTYRFLAPVAAALGKSASFRLSGSLARRPMRPLWDALRAHGVTVGAGQISGQLTAGRYTLAADVSSQFLSGLLFALPLLQGGSQITVTGDLVSRGYVRMTLDALHACAIRVETTDSGFFIPGGQTYAPPAVAVPEGDWSSAAVWLCAGACRGGGVTLTGLRRESAQGDRAICEILSQMGAQVTCKEDCVTARPAPLHGIRLDAAQIPDLIPAIAVAAAAANGVTEIARVRRLRLKESDRVAAICRAIRALGGRAEADTDTLRIFGGAPLAGGTVDGCNDHRVVMLAATASVLCTRPVTLRGAEAVRKSYPSFFHDFAALGGIIIDD